MFNKTNKGGIKPVTLNRTRLKFLFNRTIGDSLFCLKRWIRSKSKEARLRKQLEDKAFFKELEECGLFDNIKEAEE